MEKLKIKVYGIKITKKQMVVVEAICLLSFILMIVINRFIIQKPADEYSGSMGWYARYSDYIWIICAVWVIIETQIFLHRFTKRQLKIIEAHKQEIEQQKEEILAQNDEITAQNDLLEEQKKHIEYLYKEVEDSIRYAEKIQEAVLPGLVGINHCISDHFVFFKPKDIVSGDFYWFSESIGKQIFIVADCTGHGVPGAFMSMMGVSFLKEIVNIHKVTEPDRILNMLRGEIVGTFRQGGNGDQQTRMKDGMDMSVCVIDPETKICSWAGANNPLYLVRCESKESVQEVVDRIECKMIFFDDRSLREFSPDRMPVGIHDHMEPFACHSIQLNPGDRLFMFSDGFADQFGGPSYATGGKKFKYKPFKNLILETSGLSMKEQSEAIDKRLSEWMNSTEGKYDQVDDITIVGIQIC